MRTPEGPMTMVWVLDCRCLYSRILPARSVSPRRSSYRGNRRPSGGRLVRPCQNTHRVCRRLVVTVWCGHLSHMPGLPALYCWSPVVAVRCRGSHPLRNIASGTVTAWARCARGDTHVSTRSGHVSIKDVTGSQVSSAESNPNRTPSTPLGMYSHVTWLY